MLSILIDEFEAKELFIFNRLAAANNMNRQSDNKLWWKRHEKTIRDEKIVKKMMGDDDKWKDDEQNKEMKEMTKRRLGTKR